jgi:hypothetical protein
MTMARANGLVHVLQQLVEGQDDEHEERRLHEVGDETEPDQRGVRRDVLGGGGGITGHVHLCSPDVGEGAEDRDDEVEEARGPCQAFLWVHDVLRGLR